MGTRSCLTSTLKEDLQCTAAELVYGTTLRLLGEFFNDSKAEATPDPASYVTRLKGVMKVLQATPVRKQQLCTNTYVSPNLKSCTHVFIHHDAVKKPLQKPYDGPYKMIKHSNKHYTVDIDGHHEVVSIDCLKPVFHDAPPTIQPTYPIPDIITREDLPPTTKPYSATRSGCQVH